MAIAILHGMQEVVGSTPILSTRDPGNINIYDLLPGFYSLKLLPVLSFIEISLI